MTYLARKNIKGKTYLYLEKRKWINGSSRRTWQIYLGPEDRIEQAEISGILSKHSDKIKTYSIEFGISSALYKIANDIDLARIIDNNTDKFRDQGLSVGEYITLAAINRCSAPCTKSKLGKWFERDWISTQFDIEPKILNAQTYWNHFQYFSEEKLENIELELNKTVIKKYDLNLDCLFYDPTNFFTFSKGTGDKGLLQFGHSKENRNGNRLVSYSLLCARESGVPLMHHTYAGNIQDANKFKEIPEMIENRLKNLKINPKKVTLVFDKGNHSSEAFKAIDDYGFGFIVSARNSTQKDLLHITSSKFVKTVLIASNKEVEYYKTSEKVYGALRAIYVVLDPKKKKKHTEQFNEKLEEKVSEVNDFFKNRLNLKKWRDKNAVEKKMKSMIGRNPFKNIIKYTLIGTYAKLNLSIKIDEKEKEYYVETLGKTILFTNRLDWTPEEIIWGYREQYIVEHAFRKMKSPTSIAVRPMYHHSDLCVKAHVFVCVIALLLLSLLRLTLVRNSLSIDYDDLLEELSSVHALKILTSQKAKPLWRLDTPTGIAKQIIKKLRLKDML